jgi:hypothetical protein
VTALFVEAVGLAAPGLAGWSASVPVLNGETAYVAAELPPYQPALLPANERRRATALIKLAFRTAEDALAQTDRKAGDLATVFASSEGDTEVMNRITTALSTPARAISPTDFHNSVHNAAAGYWSIAVGAKQPSSSIAAYDGSFAAGLAEAAALALGDGFDTLLCAYDTRMPPPLHEKRPLEASMGVALVVTPARSPRSLAALGLAETLEPETALDDPALEAMRRAHPAMRALPLLCLLARRTAGTVRLPSGGGARARTGGW